MSKRYGYPFLLHKSLPISCTLCDKRLGTKLETTHGQKLAKYLGLIKKTVVANEKTTVISPPSR